MKKIKKFLSMMLAMVMIMGMSVTAFAETKDSATITVKAGDQILGSSATLKYVQIIVPNTSTKTGWDFASDKIAEAYIKGFKNDTAQDTPENRQEVIQALIDATKDANGYARTSEISKALSKVAATSSGVTFVNMNNPQSVTSAGVYAVIAEETGYTYSVMAAYVGFGSATVDGTTYDYPSLKDAVLTAKRSSTTLTKESADSDKFVAVGDTKAYTIKSYVPFVDPEKSVADKAYHIYDLIKGASYDAAPGFDLTGELPQGYVADTTILNNIVVTVGGVAVDTTKATATALTGEALTVTRNDVTTTYEAGFDLDLSSYVDDANTYAGQEVVVTYTTTITGTTVDNKAYAGVNGTTTPAYGEDDETLYTGEINLTKVDNDDVNVKLANAQFRVYKVEGDQETYVGFTAVSGSNGVYTYDKNAEEPAANAAPEVGTVVTNADGIIKLQGLGAGTYRLKETVAPEGYHISAQDRIDDVVLQLDANATKAEAIISKSLTVQNTKLSALPSTGGIGTTIFTLGGCAIMIIAAGLYFATRRRTAK